MEQIDALNMERQSVLQYLAKVVLNTRAEAEVKKLINSGVYVPGCAVVENYSTSLK